jgi:hypothetical protein
MIAGDADLIPDTLIRSAPVDEYAAVRADLGGLPATPGNDALATIAYQFMRNTRTVVVAPVIIPVPFPPFFLPAMVPVFLPNPFPMPNDLLVAMPSALGAFPPMMPLPLFIGPTIGRNHASIADGPMAGFVVPFLRATDMVRGDLR